ncbi:DUF4082 domain-containing protein [Nostoc sp. CENA67]|uniref:DUF4082 domain-containing protein n=1 Tax=Amazonocrinis nigriterrae CENA67 TaxID=2794033 RepID=A0A8J7LBD1_9NOST|nr:DUF4082 domain-containing protein [Amazonocrinis nigriterrae]MBH8563571.1 DUF4082 domain-containing protein [Amazonocrinis nigriterrae CENA67]
MKRLIKMMILMLITTLLVLGSHMGFPLSMQRVLAQADPCTSPVNAIVAENCQAGNPSSEWNISGAGDSSIQGFASDISVNKGDTISFKIKTNATNYRLDIYRMGYYSGNGARKVTTIQRSLTQAQNQPNCLQDTTTGLIDCGNWSVSASWSVPTNATSGIYFAKVVRTDTGGASHIVFIVRDDTSTSDLLFQTSDTTWQAYNNYGGNSLYTGSPAGRAYKVSYNRPFNTRAVDSGQDFLFNAEYPMVRWLEANGYNVSYFTGVDSDRRGNLIRNHKVFLSVAHDEYWSNNQRANVENARNLGTHLAFFSGNEVFWKTRWENSIDSSATPYRTLVTYKETQANAVIDPQDPPTWTGTWRDPRFSPPADGGRPENALTGTIFKVNGGTTAIQVPEADGKMRLWRNTDIANLSAGSTATLAPASLGYEWDEDSDNGSRPAGLVRLSSTTANNVEVLQDYGSTYANGTATHHLTLYKHSSGALVFGAGTIQWSWGLDANHDNTDRGNTTDVRMQQATVNLLADMGVQPATLQSNLLAATASTDTTAPTSTITSPTTGTNIPVGSQATITGTATDAGGVVGAVEVSVDGGTTWHPANGRASWSYSWTPVNSGSITINTRASDDSVNVETPGAGITVTVGGERTCPCTIWDSTATPTNPSDSDTSAVEVGVKFRSDKDGKITGIRFYKGSSNTGTHVGTLWSSTGTQLATATFNNETTSGWQQVDFSSPVAITANTVYVASYHTNVGRYASDDGYFASAGVDNAPLHALRNGDSGGNGVYSYSSTSTFPTSTFQSTNYWVDVVFTTSTTPDTTPPTVSVTTPSNGATNVSVGGSVTATFSEAMDSTTINTDTFKLQGPNSTISATVTYNANNNTATLIPSSSLTPSTIYSATIKGGTTDPRVKDQAGNALAADFTWSFTTAAADTTPPTVTSTTPSNNATGVSTGTSVTATFSEAMDSTTINTSTFELQGPNSTISATVTYNANNNTATLTPNSPLAISTTYSATVKGGSTDPRVKDVAGNALAANVTWSFTTGTGATSIWNNSVTPTVVADPDNAAIEVGVKFRSDVKGKITGIRFYKSATNTGTHVGTLWSSTGTQLKRATFSNETASGWQQVNFATPQTITANTTYVASYHTNVGHYSVDEGYFANAGVDNPPLHALANGVSGSNGVYKYSSTATFPNNTYQSSNYWVDIVFAPN